MKIKILDEALVWRSVKHVLLLLGLLCSISIFLFIAFEVIDKYGGLLDVSPSKLSVDSEARSDPAFICVAECSPRALILNRSRVTITESWIQLRESRFPSTAKYFLCLRTDPDDVHLDWFDHQAAGTAWELWNSTAHLTFVDLSESLYKSGSWVIKVHNKSPEPSDTSVTLSWDPTSPKR